MGTLPSGVASTRAELLGGAASTGALSLVVRPAQGRSPADAGVAHPSSPSPSPIPALLPSPEPLPAEDMGVQHSRAFRMFPSFLAGEPLSKS
ncbi:unnamed protein product [Miscanthus lutarioriparius]|uniref:Uncharacterized protein n=1 Tax=Miscanthus lutarioriparius TaxID=422564 RepID=A0A811NJ10_9POAL|nr:unnamed protein product [Miscanthus lutarioriparius]